MTTDAMLQLGLFLLVLLLLSWPLGAVISKIMQGEISGPFRILKPLEMNRSYATLTQALASNDINQSSPHFEINGSCVDNNFILEVTAVNETFNVDTASFTWFNSNQQLIGSNNTTLDVTDYLLSTTAEETMPITFSVTVTTPDGCLRNEPITLDRIFCGIQKGISVSK